MNLAQGLNLNTQRNSSIIREGDFVLVFSSLIIPFVLSGVINLQFTVRRSMVETPVADGNLGFCGPVLQWVLAK